MRFFCRNSVLFLLVLNLLVLIFNFSASYSKFAFLMIALFSWLIYEKRLNIFNPTIFHLTGGWYYLNLVLALLLSFFYGYSVDYVLINLMIVLPLFSIHLIKGDFINISHILKTIAYFSLISVVFSLIIYFLWEQTPFIRDLVMNPKSLFLARFYEAKSTGGRIIRSVGLFEDAYINGVFILAGYVIFLERFINGKLKLSSFIFLTLGFGVALYSTHTRNVYFLSFFTFFLFFITRTSLMKINNLFFFILVLLYLITVSLGVSYAYLDPGYHNSVYSRVSCWGTIINEYFLNGLSFNTIFGFGITQLKNDSSPILNFAVIDNSILAIYLSSGILGLILFISWIKGSLNFLIRFYNESKDQKRSELRILITFISIFFIGGAMNVNILNMLLIFPILLILKKLILEEQEINPK